MNNSEAIALVLLSSDSVAVCTHIVPDGDTIGSALAMKLGLEQLGKKVQVFCTDKVPDNLHFLPGAEMISAPDPEDMSRFDTLLAVDVSDPGRLGNVDNLRKRCGRMIQIDHHGTNPMYAEVNYVEGKASATCLMVLDQLKRMNVRIDRDIAICLYTGISTDTGNFSFQNTSAEAFRAMSELMEAGLPLPELNRVLFRQRSCEQLLLLGKAIRSLRRFCDGRLAVMRLTQQDFEDCGALQEHSDTLVNFALDTVGTVMALLTRENKNGEIKCSLRAMEPFCVSDVARAFGGGGHDQASGITLHGTLDEVTEKIIGAMAEKLNGN